MVCNIIFYDFCSFWLVAINMWTNFSFKLHLLYTICLVNMVRLVTLTEVNSVLLLDLLWCCPAASRLFLTPDNTVSWMLLKTEGPIRIHNRPITSPTKTNIITMQVLHNADKTHNFNINHGT